MNTVSQIEPKYYRSIFISDVHLGFHGCSAKFLLDFLRSTRCDNLYLVGDIIDGWQMKKRMYWPQEHNDVIRTILGKAKHGTKITYVTGNHDEFLREHSGMTFGNLTIVDEAIYESRSGKNFLIIHGDQFDGVVISSKFLGHIGSSLYDALIQMNTWVNIVRRKLGFPYWSLAKMLKHKVKNAVEYIGSFEDALTHFARERDVDGVVCGHIHHAEMREIDGILYCNDGDWVESCTSLIEHKDGRLEIVYWQNDFEQSTISELEELLGNKQAA